MKTTTLIGSPSHLLTNVQYSQFMRDHLHHLGLIDKNELSNAELNMLIATLVAVVGDFDKVMKKVTKSAFSEKIGDLDNNRDNSFRSLRQALKSERNTADASVQEAVNAIEIFIDTYENVPKLTLEEETRAIDEIVTVLEGRLKPMVDVVGVANKVARLKADNETFKAKYAQRTSEYIDKDTTDNREVRQQVNDAYFMLFDYALMMARLDKGAIFDKLVAIANTIRKEYASQVNRTGERKKEEEKK